MANERLYQFPSKASPVPADIIYVGDSASAFDEVNCTIAEIISAYPNLLGIGNLTLSANTFIYSNNAATLTAGSISALAVSLLGDTTVSAMQGTLGYVATPTASQFAGWDANSNISANNMITGYATTATATGTTTLTVASAGQQYFTGSTTQTVVMPVASTLVVGQSWLFVNLSTGTITIQSSGGNTIVTVGANQSTRVTCILASGTGVASWSSATPVAGEGVVSSGTINDLAYYASSGTTISPLATANNGVLVTSAGGVPSISTTLPASLVIPSPQITTGLYDANNKLMLAFSPQVNAVNYFTIANSPTTSALSFGATGTDTNIIVSLTGKGTGNVQVGGTGTNDSASAGFVGEYISSSIASGSAVSLSNGSAGNITSISLTAGDWDVSGNIWFIPASGTVATYLAGAVTSVSNTFPTAPNGGAAVQLQLTFPASLQQGFYVGKTRVSVATTTSIYLVGFANFTVSTMTAYGFIGARRVR